jgi:hypothetical protein
MALPPIHLQLSKFEQIEILRAEIELREGELKQAEKQIRDTLYELERQRYLQSVHPIFSQLPPPEQAANLTQFNANREALGEAIQAMQTTLGALEAETAGQVAPPSRGLNTPRPGTAPGTGAGALPPRRPKFDSFDDFRANKGGGN